MPFIIDFMFTMFLGALMYIQGRKEGMKFREEQNRLTMNRIHELEALCKANGVEGWEYVKEEDR